MGRPRNSLKINNNFIEATKKVINDITAIAFTDEEFLFEVNWELGPVDRICPATFYNYIKKEKTEDIVNETLKSFLELLKKARHKAKIALITELRTKPERWQAFAWILERKYTEFNLKEISEHKFDIQPIKIVIDLNQKSIEKSTEENKEFTNANLVLA